MKRLILLPVLCAMYSVTLAQQPVAKDSTRSHKNDTIRIGSIMIIKKHSKGAKDSDSSVTEITNTRKSNSRISTNYGIIDLGFANWTDQSDYSATGSYLVSRPGFPKLSGDDLKLKAGKSINVNIWFFMQKLQLVKNHVNLKYGLGLELNNYRFRSPISFKENGPVPYSNGLQTNAPFIFRDSIAFTKNKLAADYLTVPLMINFTTAKQSGKPGFSASFGVSGGYLYSQRNKQISTERGKQKNKGDYDLERFKFSYVAEIGISPVRLYGSYSPKSIFEKSLDLRPYTVGIRFSNW